MRRTSWLRVGRGEGVPLWPGPSEASSSPKDNKAVNQLQKDAFHARWKSLARGASVFPFKTSDANAKLSPIVTLPIATTSIVGGDKPRCTDVDLSVASAVGALHVHTRQWQPYSCTLDTDAAIDTDTFFDFTAAPFKILLVGDSTMSSYFKALKSALSPCTCRCCLLCMYMPAIDRSLSDCRHGTASERESARGRPALLRVCGFRAACGGALYVVSFQWKNPDFLLKNPDFLIRNPDFLLKNADFILQQPRWDRNLVPSAWASGAAPAEGDGGWR